MTNVPTGMAVTALLPSEPVGGWGTQGLSLLLAPGSEQGGPRTRAGAGRGVGLCGFPVLQSSIRELGAPRSLSQRAAGPCCWASIYAPAGPAVAARTYPHFAWPHWASMASHSSAGLGLGFVQPQAEGTLVVLILLHNCSFLLFSPLLPPLQLISLD